MPFTIPSTGTIRGPEGLILDPNSIAGAPIDLGSVTNNLRLASLVIPPAQKQPTWATSGDSDGSQLVRVPYYANRDCTMQIRVSAADADSAMAAVGQLQEKLGEVERLAAGGGNGLPVLWTPAGASTGLTLYVVLANITDMPITVADGWFAHKPLLTVAFTCKPFLYGDEVTGPSASGSGLVVTLDVPSVPGDVPAEARLVITDTASHARRYAEWALEQYHYNPSSPSPSVIDSGSLVVSGFAGTALAHSGAYGGTTIATSLLSQPVAVCGTGNQPHVGSWRVKARVYAPSTDEYWSLSWQDGDAPFRSNTPSQPVAAAGFSEVDLGIITVQPATLGSQNWSGRLEAYTTSSGETGELDALILWPVDEGYERIAATYGYQPGAITSHDEFTGTTAGSALNGRVAPSGGTWVTSGTTPDFVFADGPGATDETVYRSGVADWRYAIVGTTRTDTETAVQVLHYTASTNAMEQAVIARWTDASNHLRLRLVPAGNSGTLYLETLVAGVTTVLGSTAVSTVGGAWLTLRLIAFASGRTIGTLLDASGATITELQALATSLASGALASGLTGFADRKTTTGSADRYYDNFYAGTPAPEPLIINSGKCLQITSDGDYRQSADGASYGEVISRGSRLFIPPAGPANRTSRITVRATRNDLTTMADTSVADGDSLSAQIYYTPRYLAVPRS